MPDPIPFPSTPTLSFTPEDAQWLVLALETMTEMLASGLSERGEDYKTDHAFQAYSRLEERCRQFSHANPVADDVD